MKVILLILLSIWITLSTRATGDLPARIRASVKVQSVMDKAIVDLTYTLRMDSAASRLQFYLAKEAVISSIRGDKLARFEFDTSLNLPIVNLYLTNTASKEEVIELFFNYEIPLDTLNTRKYGFIELGLDWLWFPVHPGMSHWKFKFDLLVETDDPRFELFSNGIVERISANLFGVTSLDEDFDIDLFLMKEPRMYSDEEKVVKIVGSSANASLKDSILRLTNKYLNFYQQFYDTRIRQVTAIIRPILNDPNGFGYARKGYFVLSEPARLSQLTFYIAHELAHFWWLNGEPTENAWITESFAEYSALLLTKQLDGDSVYQSIIADKYARVERMKKDGRNVPVVFGSGTKNKSQFSHIALYHKGPVILHELMEKIGEKKMLEIFKKGAEKKIATTEQFLELLRKKTNRNIVNFVEERLKTY